MIQIRATATMRYSPFVTLIAVNCLVVVLQFRLTPVEFEEFLLRFALIPAPWIRRVGAPIKRIGAPLILRDRSTA